MNSDLHFDEYQQFRRDKAAGNFEIPSDVRNINHAVYINKMTHPFNNLNKLLHEQWERWARRARFFGQNDWLVKESSDGLSTRQKCIERYSYAIPNEASLRALSRLGPILEVGSGSGYWAFLLRSKCVDIIAIDDRSCPKQWKFDWFPMTQIIDAREYLIKHNGCPRRSLFMCWPTDADEILSLYKGENVIIVGETSGSCWEMPDDSGWCLSSTIEIPVWPGLHDRMLIYQRASR